MLPRKNATETRPRAGSPKQICDAYGIGATFLYREIKEGRLRAFKLGRATRILFEDAEAWFQSHQKLAA